eukprot:4444843-Pleurochrysis_carterae.AAC.3
MGMEREERGTKKREGQKESEEGEPRGREESRAKLVAWTGGVGWSRWQEGRDGRVSRKGGFVGGSGAGGERVGGGTNQASQRQRAPVYACVCVCACARVCAWGERVCVCACARARVRACACLRASV